MSHDMISVMTNSFAIKYILSGVLSVTILNSDLSLPFLDISCLNLKYACVINKWVHYFFC